MKSKIEQPIKQTPDQIIVDKNKVESLTKRFLTAVKGFFQTVLGKSTWDRLGLEETWRYFLPLIIIVSLFLVTVAAKIMAWITLMITGIWLLRKAFKK